MDHDICMDCYKQNVFLPYSCTLDDVLSLEEMKRFLKEKKNQLLGNNILPHEVQELYNVAMISETQNNTNVDTVPFPVHCTNALKIEDKKFGFGELVHSFEIQNGGQFINAPEATDKMIVPIINLFASIVHYKKPEAKTTESRK